MVLVYPFTQTVECMFCCVTSALMAPGVSDVSGKSDAQTGDDNASARIKKIACIIF